MLLGNEIEDDLGPQDRIRVSSISGRPVRQDGVGIVIGNESSSESEDEADDTCKLRLTVVHATNWCIIHAVERPLLWPTKCIAMYL